MNANEFTLKQLETIIWALAKKGQKAQKKFIDHEEYQRKTIEAIIDKVQQKAPSMKGRGVAFAVESLCILQYKNEETFKRLERVVLAKLDDFIPHYSVKVLQSYYKMGYGSGELYDKLINQVVQQMAQDSNLKYSDMLKLFEVFPEVTYIYESTMSEELHTLFT